MDPANSVLRSVARHPWTSAQDLLLISGAMIGAVVLTLEYELFSFADQLTIAERRITLAETIFLTALLAAGIVAFVVRRLREERIDQAREFERDQELRNLRVQAMQDPLTGLPNRRAMLSALTDATSGPSSNGRRHAFFLLDLNDFKRVNDLCGHAAGDRVLQMVVERFKAAARPTDVLARLGGDEFALLSFDVTRDGAHAIGERFITCLHSPIRVDANLHEIGVSIGATLIPEDGIIPQEILRNADCAMYAAKDAKRSAMEFYTVAAGVSRGSRRA
jgi:diguanylate cyclase (GGDEF)-like protein